jgi:hypothetical protein
MAVREGRTYLTDLTGSGDNVFVVAWVTHIIDLNTHLPYQKGWLGDGSLRSDEKRPFVVYDPDVRLEKGSLYRLNGYDHPYEPFDEIQLRLDKGAFVERVER